jgi:hypothetical protein
MYDWSINPHIFTSISKHSLRVERMDERERENIHRERGMIERTRALSLLF